MIDHIPEQVQHLNRLVNASDTNCIDNLRMDRNTFGRLCYLLRHLGGLSDAKYVLVEEQVAMFLSILGHHKKNRVVKFDFIRSGQTVSRYVHVVLKSILKLHALMLVKPEPVPDDNINPRWKWFKDCLGALDGTYIDVKVRARDKGRYRTRKGSIAINVLVVCDREMMFVYVLPGWEGSAANARVLRDAVNRVHGLRVPKGQYYLCDNGHANIEGFLTPYKGVRYHLDEWDQRQQHPQSMQEHFNMRHTRARNIIERAFGVMKMRWGILRSATYYPIKVQIRLIMACFLLHNFSRSEMVIDPFKVLAEEAHAGNIPGGHPNEASIRRAMNAVNNAFNTCLDYRYCAMKFMKLKQRFDIFKWMISLTDIAYDPSKNWVGCDEKVWESIVRRGPKIVDAFKEKGEPMYAAMKVIFEGRAENIEPDDE